MMTVTVLMEIVTFHFEWLLLFYGIIGCGISWNMMAWSSLPEAHTKPEKPTLAIQGDSLAGRPLKGVKKKFSEGRKYLNIFNHFEANKWIKSMDSSVCE